ncbi:LuxE/PaaK family acyltransferase [Desertivirga arenae]|uniref:LuxE/PaaK family acyltransferase n=1 Tax=Desertivirga arenae TaxID=2810309 RepID=UPI001A95DB8A|nr:acyl transferase [Pedobacter sp. SYSU D00823]
MLFNLVNFGTYLNKVTNFPIDKIFSIQSSKAFESQALDVFRYQAKENKVYSAFVDALNIDVNKVESIEQIPFLPIEFFKSHSVITGDVEGTETVFSSSGTTGISQSKHFVKDIGLYDRSFQKGFELLCDNITDITILALLPSYLERDGSSLIYMIDSLINSTQNTDSGYYLYNHSELYQKLQVLKQQNRKVLLIGVTYALLDFIETYRVDFPDLIVMETGGMKGKRKEMIREELHSLLTAGFGVAKIYSEYGMTELLSQAYSRGDGIFECPAWMRVLIRDTNDPLSYLIPGQTGGINVIDLANVYSCSFIATQDLGKVYADGSFEVLGRFDNSDIRGCNLLVQ